VWHGEARQGMARQGMARQGQARQGRDLIPYKIKKWK